eukprot:scaffold2160_cov144-Isochrysis_galbana.AAC.2
MSSEGGRPAGCDLSRGCAHRLWRRMRARAAGGHRSSSCPGPRARAGVAVAFAGGEEGMPCVRLLLAAGADARRSTAPMPLTPGATDALVLVRVLAAAGADVKGTPQRRPRGAPAGLGGVARGRARAAGRGRRPAGKSKGRDPCILDVNSHFDGGKSQALRWANPYIRSKVVIVP